jgi:hypothetical protein
MSSFFPPFNPGHGFKILFFAGFISEAGISSRLFYASMSQQHLKALQTHAGIEKFGGKSMPKGVDRISLMGKASFYETPCKYSPGSAVTHPD